MSPNKHVHRTRPSSTVRAAGHTALHSGRQGTNLRTEYPSNRTLERKELRAHSVTASTSSLSGCRGKNVAESFIKLPCDNAVLQKNNTEDSGQFLDAQVPTRYLLFLHKVRVVNSQNNRQWCSKNTVACHQVPSHDLRV